MDVVATAELHLKQVSYPLSEYIEALGPCTLKPSSSPFDVLVQSIIGQQLSLKAASSIGARLKLVVGNEEAFVVEDFLGRSINEMTSAGLSRAKSICLSELSQFAYAGRLDFASMSYLSDEEIVTKLTEVRGIGRWTAEMFLIFALHRQDVFSKSDSGLKRGMRKLYNLSGELNDELIEDLSKTWRPYRSVACWYLWKLVDAA